MSKSDARRITRLPGGRNKSRPARSIAIPDQNRDCKGVDPGRTT